MCSGNTDILYLDTVSCLFSRQILHIPASSVTARGGLKAPSPLSHFWHFPQFFLRWYTIYSHSSVSLVTVSDHCPVCLVPSIQAHTCPKAHPLDCPLLPMAYGRQAEGCFVSFCLKCSWRLFGGCYGLNPPQAYVFPEGGFYRAGEGAARILRVRAYLEQADHCERVFDRHVKPWSLPLPASCLALWELLCHPSHSGRTKKLWNYELDKSSFTLSHLHLAFWDIKKGNQHKRERECIDHNWQVAFLPRRITLLFWGTTISPPYFF